MESGNPEPCKILNLKKYKFYFFSKKIIRKIKINFI